jgi:hypothetical protein
MLLCARDVHTYFGKFILSHYCHYKITLQNGFEAHLVSTKILSQSMTVTSGVSPFTSTDFQISVFLNCECLWYSLPCLRIGFALICNSSVTWSVGWLVESEYSKSSIPWLKIAYNEFTPALGVKLFLSLQNFCGFHDFYADTSQLHVSCFPWKHHNIGAIRIFSKWWQPKHLLTNLH